MAVQRAEDNHKHKGNVVAGTVRKTIGKVAQAFRGHDEPDPRLDKDYKTHTHLETIFSGMQSQDPQKKQQKALPPAVLLYIFDKGQTNPFLCIVANILIAALFFACRSCEYLKTSGERKTKLLTVENIVFRRKTKVIKSYKEEDLRKVTSVSITFTKQKNKSDFETITQHASHHPILCPVKRWAAVIGNLSPIPSFGPTTPVCTFVNKAGQEATLTCDQILKLLRWAVSEIGEDIIGFSAKEIGTHSIRSGGTMAMYLSGVPIITIMLIGRWRSDSFIKYIQKQILQFTSGVSEKMASISEFYTIPSNITTTSHEFKQLNGVWKAPLNSHSASTKSFEETISQLIGRTDKLSI